MQSAKYLSKKRPDSLSTNSKMVAAFSLIVFLLGYAVRPNSVSDGRVANILIGDINGCNTLKQWLLLDFPSKIYAAIDHLLLINLDTIAAWDSIIFLLGIISVLTLVIYFTQRWDYSISQSLFLWSAIALCGIYIFIFNKDVIQFFIFSLAFLIVASRLTITRKMLLLMGVFLCEFLWWRQYYAIVAAFIPLFYLLIRYVKNSSLTPLGKLCLVVFLTLCSAMVFSFALSTLSHENYVTIVEKHGSERESFTATSAVSGITSVIEVTGSSPVPLFVANWMINTLRLLFPIELFLLGPYYWVFAAYQLYLSFNILKAIGRCNEDDTTVILAGALYFSFLLASATFEPDFGSWVRHETAALPILLFLVSQNARQSIRMGVDAS